MRTIKQDISGVDCVVTVEGYTFHLPLAYYNRAGMKQQAQRMIEQSTGLCNTLILLVMWLEDYENTRMESYHG